jgi:hypothetical protein
MCKILIQHLLRNQNKLLLKFEKTFRNLFWIGSKGVFSVIHADFLTHADLARIE